MKFAFIVFMLSVDFVFAQSRPVACSKGIDTLTNIEIYNSVDIPPKVIGGMAALMSEVATKELPKDPATGQVKLFISLLIESNGELSHLKTIGEGGSEKLDEELFAIFKKYKWSPGQCNGINVSSRVVFNVKS